MSLQQEWKEEEKLKEEICQETENKDSTDSGKYECYYWDGKGYQKDGFQKWKEKKRKIHCNYCDVDDHNAALCFKLLKLELKDMKGGVHC